MPTVNMPVFLPLHSSVSGWCYVKLGFWVVTTTASTLREDLFASHISPKELLIFPKTGVYVYIHRKPEILPQVLLRVFKVSITLQM